MTELGNRLKEAREAKGMTLDDLQEITKIQKRYLAGIEEGNYDSIPGKFYVRAFIKQYAEAVGLDSESLFEEYRSDVPSVYEENLTEQLSRTQTRATVPQSSSKFMENLPKLLTAVVIIVIAFFLWYFISNAFGKNDTVDSGEGSNTPPVSYDESGEPAKSEQPNTNVENKEDTQDENTTDENVAEEDTEEESNTQEQQLTVVTTEGKTTTYQLTNSSAFQLDVKATSGGKSWVEIYNTDNKQYFKAMLTEENPQSFDLTNESGARLRIGATGSTEIYINGEKLEYAIDATVQNIVIEYQKEGE